MEANSNSKQFGPCLADILQKIWKADPREGLVLLSKWDVSDASLQCPLCPHHVGTLSYVVPLLESDPTVYIYIDLFLHMG